MERWEYKTIKFKTGGFWGGRVDNSEFQDELNFYGKEGWELVSCFDTSQAQGASKDVIVVFKRKLIGS